jgi:drug/metabolite transporter (DMT)-like permease
VDSIDLGVVCQRSWVLTATVLSLAAAVLHAAWNLSIKTTDIDRFTALWGQFAMAALLYSPLVFIFGDLPATAWLWVALSGAVHLPYCWFLARAYGMGDFSLVYPIARGGGAVLAALGGIALLDDRFSTGGIVAIVVVGAGLMLLAGRGASHAVAGAAIVALTIGVYTVADAKGIRASTPWYALASMLGTATSTTLFNLARGRSHEMVIAMKNNWRRFALVGTASTATYGMVQLAMRSAPVGYVTALRESSVVLAAFIGWRRLGEPAGLRRVLASVIVLGGLLLLVLSR